MIFKSKVHHKNFKGKIKWVWIDTYDDFDLDIYEADILRNFKLCLVSPTRWGHEDKINYYIEKFQKFDPLPTPTALPLNLP